MDITLLPEIERFLALTGMGAADFGEAAVKDRHFVYDLRGVRPKTGQRRKPRRVWPETAARVRAFMDLRLAELQAAA